VSDWREREALWRYGLIREAADPALTPSERGRLVRALAGRPQRHHSGELRSPGRSTLDGWIRAYRRGGFAALKPAERRVAPRTPAELLAEAEALRREEPARTGALIGEIIRRRQARGRPRCARSSATWRAWAWSAPAFVAACAPTAASRPSGRTSSG
jgi:putative transposase